MICVDVAESNLSIVKNFSISDLERFTGIKAHTLRTWENRYLIGRPARSKNKSRYYSFDETQKLLNIAVLNKIGYKISFLASLTPGEIAEKLDKLTDPEARQQKSIVDLTLSMYLLDITRFESTVSHCFGNWPDEVVLKQIIYPFLKMHALLWHGNKQIEEHFVVTALRSKMIHAAEKTNLPTRDKKVVLFLNSTKQLDLALLYTCFCLKHSGIRVVNLGSDVSIDNLQSLFEKVQPSLLYTYLPAKNNFDFARLAELMQRYAPHCKLVVTTHTPDSHPCFSSGSILHMSLDNAVNFLCS